MPASVESLGLGKDTSLPVFISHCNNRLIKIGHARVSSENLLEQQYFIGDIELMLDKGRLPAICVLVTGARDLQPLIIYFNYIQYLHILEKGNMLCQPKSLILLHVDLEGQGVYSLRDKQLFHTHLLEEIVGRFHMFIKKYTDAQHPCICHPFHVSKAP